MTFHLDSMLVLLCYRVSSLSWSRGPEGTTSQLQEFLDSTFCIAPEDGPNRPIEVVWQSYLSLELGTKDLSRRLLGDN